MPSTRAIIPYRPTDDEELLLTALAAKLGLSKSRTLAFALRRAAEIENIQPTTVALTDEEQEDIARLYAQLTPEYWQRRRGLEEKQRSGAIPPAEHEELLRLIEKGEAWNVRRLRYFFDLARKYNRPPDYFLDALGLRHHPLAERL